MSAFTGNPSDVGTGYNPYTDPNANYGYSTAPSAPPVPYVPSSLEGPSSVSANTNTGGSSPGAMTTGGTTTNNGTTNAGTTGNTQGAPDWNNLFNEMFNPATAQEYANQSQQWLNYLTGQYMPWQMQMGTSGLTGMVGSQYTLPAQQQGWQEALAANSQNMNNALAWSQLTGMVGGAPNLQANALMNQYNALANNQQLSNLGLTNQYAGGLEGLGSNLANAGVGDAQVLAQLLNSPAVGFYTGRGQAPPQSYTDLINSLQGQLNPSNELQQMMGVMGAPGVGNYQQLYGQSATPYTWNLSNAPPPVGNLPVQTPTGPNGAPQTIGAPGAPAQMPQNWQGAMNALTSGYQQNKNNWNPNTVSGILGQYGIPQQVSQNLWNLAQTAMQQGQNVNDPNTWYGLMSQAINQYNQSNTFGSVPPVTGPSNSTWMGASAPPTYSVQ